MTGPRYLNAGCGPQHMDGWVNLDTDPGAAADLLADVRGGLPFAAGTFQRVYASHLLEHLSWFDDLFEALAEFRRVLHPDGILCIVCPDIERAVMLGEPGQLLRAIVSWPEDFIIGATREAKRPPTGHAWTASARMVAHALDRAGFTGIREHSGRLLTLQAKGWPVVDLGDWQCGFTAQPVDR